MSEKTKPELNGRTGDGLRDINVMQEDGSKAVQFSFSVEHLEGTNVLTSPELQCQFPSGMLRHYHMLAVRRVIYNMRLDVQVTCELGGQQFQVTVPVGPVSFELRRTLGPTVQLIQCAKFCRRQYDNLSPAVKVALGFAFSAALSCAGL